MNFQGSNNNFHFQPLGALPVPSQCYGKSRMVFPISFILASSSLTLPKPKPNNPPSWLIRPTAMWKHITSSAVSRWKRKALTYAKRCDTPRNCCSSGKSALWRSSFDSPQSLLPTVCSSSSPGFCEVIHLLKHCSTAKGICHLLRHKVSVKQRWLSLVQEYFWCRQAGSLLLGWLDIFPWTHKSESFKTREYHLFPCLCLSW